MQLVLLRHAPAETRDPSRWPDDSQRPLTGNGRRVAREVARGLKAVPVRAARLRTSPAVRCEDTAKITARAFNHSASVDVWPELAFGATPEQLLARLQRSTRANGSFEVLVGHEPALGRLASLLLFGEPVPSIRHKRGGAALIETPRKPAAGSGKLEWVLTRRQLAKLGNGKP